MAHFMTDDEFAQLLSFVPEAPSCAFDWLSDLPGSSSGVQDMADSGTHLLAQFPGQDSQDLVSHLPVCDTSGLPLADFHDSANNDMVGQMQGFEFSQLNAMDHFNVERATEKREAGPVDHSQPILDMVQEALGKMIAKQEEYMQGVAEKQEQQDQQLRVLNDKIDNIREGLDSFSADVWRWTRPDSLTFGDELYSSEYDNSEMSGVLVDESSWDENDDWIDDLP